MQQNLTPEQILAMARQLRKSGKDEEQMQQALSDMLMHQIEPGKAAQVKQMLQNKTALEQMMQSSQAKQWMQRLQDQ